MSLTVRAKRLSDGREVALNSAVKLQVGASLFSPAVSMNATFAVSEAAGRLGEVWVFDGGELLFSGKVDRQSQSLSAKGLLLELEARSKGALLLDNEALPCVLTNVHLPAVFSRFIAPYGFTFYNPNTAFTLPVYTVRSGMSEWEALCGFTRRAWGVTPYVEGDVVRVEKPKGNGVPLVISNTSKGQPFTRLEQSYIPYKMVSRVILRDEWGSYSAAVGNSSAVYHGVQRKRYVIPANEFMDNPALDANQRIRKSMLDSEQVEATLPGIVEIRCGHPVHIVDKALEAYNLMVGELEYQLSDQGMVTKLRLLNTVYY